ncbi:fused MFS/spermidine synthase [Colwellia sp. UCD-KL20]|uniref:spermidine synthase n=1 Tax=Colwellia sp. UCD-KL20 TaxID=1917165 RepID=UPI00097025C0|nr:fused MFS/spermidine synthase [Colwellia sp. UCD-KL20]
MFKYLSLIVLMVLPSLSYAKVIHSERSLYRNIIVDEKGNQRCLKFNTKSSKTNQSCIFTNNPNKLVFNYTKLVFSSLLMIDDPKKVLIIGLGGGTLSNTIHQIYPDALIDNVEIDPAVTSVAREYFGFIENEKIKSFTQDGRIFIKRAKLNKQTYDWIILDAFNGDYIPEHLLTKEFFEETKSVLAKDGIISANTFSISKLYNHESATYYDVFGDFINVSNKRNSNRIILAGYAEQPSDKIIKARVERLSPLLKPFDIDIKEIRNNMTSTKDNMDWPENTKVLTDQYSPANLLNL